MLDVRNALPMSKLTWNYSATYSGGDYPCLHHQKLQRDTQYNVPCTRLTISTMLPFGPNRCAEKFGNPMGNTAQGPAAPPTPSGRNCRSVESSADMKCDGQSCWCKFFKQTVCKNEFPMHDYPGNISRTQCGGLVCQHRAENQQKHRFFTATARSAAPGSCRQVAAARRSTQSDNLSCLF